MRIRFLHQPTGLVLLLLVLVTASCQKRKEVVSESGLRYFLYTDNPGQKAALGDYVTIDLVYKSEKDSILFDSRKSQVPMRFQLKEIPFRNSFEEGLTYLSAGDSATFFISADSMFNHMQKNKHGRQSQENTVFKNRSFIKFDVKMRRIQTFVEAEQEIQMEFSAMQKQESADLKRYILNKKIIQQPDSHGIVLIMHQEGKGMIADSGKLVTVNYVGKLLNDSVFDSTAKEGRPYHFVPGAHQVIKAWEMIFPQLKAGTKFTMIIPSAFAYGEEGLRNPQDGTYLIKPYSPLLFDIEILDVSEIVSAAK